MLHEFLNLMICGTLIFNVSDVECTLYDMLRPLMQKDSQQTSQHNPNPSVMRVSEAARLGDVIVIDDGAFGLTPGIGARGRPSLK